MRHVVLAGKGPAGTPVSLAVDAAGRLRTTPGGFGWPVAVNSDWGDIAAGPENAWDDVQAATGLAAPVGADGANKTLYISLWEGSADSDDYTVLRVHDGEATYLDVLAQDNAAWESAPSTGTAYIIGITYDFTAAA